MAVWHNIQKNDETMKTADTTTKARDESNKNHFRLPLKFSITLAILTFLFLIPQLLRSASYLNQFTNERINEYDEIFQDNDEYIDNFKSKDESKEGFSACLLIMDDNHRLVEWLAYHHYVLPLKHLIISVDPRSMTSPKSILDRWRKYGMIIDEWSDENFGTPRLKTVGEFDITKNYTDGELTDFHRWRQTTFIGSCMRHLQELNKTWVLLIDTDEFIHYNGPNGTSNDNGYNSDGIPVTYGSVKEYGTLFKFLNDRQEKATLQHTLQQKQQKSMAFPKCISLPRLTFSPEETVDDSKQKIIASKTKEFNTTMLDTIRFRKHGKRNAFGDNRWTKSIVDVSQYKKNEIKPNPPSIHMPTKDCFKWLNDQDAIFRVNHYIGSRKSHASRIKDPRHGYKTAAPPLVFADEDDSIREWMDGFIEYHGNDQALNFLQNAGVVGKITT